MKTEIYWLILLLFCCHLSLCGCSKDEKDDPVIPPVEKPEEPKEPEEPEPEPVIRTFTVTPNENGRLILSDTDNEQYQPGDTIFLRGVFKYISLDGLKGSTQEPILITNYPGEPVIIGNPAWDGGGFAQGIQITNCQHFILGGEYMPTDFIIEGSTNETARHAYFNLNLRKFTDNVEIRNMTIRNGGMGITAKTDPELEDLTTWHPNNKLENLTIHDVIISGASEEGMYLGHTALIWAWDGSGKGYNATYRDKVDPSHTIAEPIKWENIKVYNNYVEKTGNDAIQVVASDRVEIYDNEVTLWALNGISAHSGGILVGNRTTSTYIHDNYIHDGYGEMLQFFGDLNTSHRIHNNLFVNSTSNGIAIYDGSGPSITNNTIVHCNGYALKANARKITNAETVSLSNNVFIECLLEDRHPWITDIYVRKENGALVDDNGNMKFESVAEALVDSTNYYLPEPGSFITKEGYRRK